MPVPPGPIIFERVSFRHRAQNTDSGTAQGLFNLNLRIEREEFLGVTGCSGVGKTTFADLLVGLCEPQSGIITVGGRVLNGSWLSSWQTELSYVSQDTILFRDTVRRNLSWTTSSASELDLWTALDVCGASDFVRRLEMGLDTTLGDRGASISGGERQRIALARALIRKPKLLVLDEATSAIDSGGEYDILNRLRQMSKRPTIVLIAHRMKNLAVCDRVLRFESSRFHTVAHEDRSIARSIDETIL
jgi:ATP-binding cassette subfamily C protein